MAKKSDSNLLMYAAIAAGVYLLMKKSNSVSGIGATHNVDEDKLREIFLFTDNDSHLHEKFMQNYIPAMKKKLKSGKYDANLAIKLMEYYHSNYVRPYMKDQRHYGTDYQLNPAERKAFGEYYRDKAIEYINEGS
jgi:hypothetical protein